jgi:hypothetical protein
VLKEQDALLDCLSADGAIFDLISAILAACMAASEHHVFDSVEAHGAHCLLLDILQLLLQLLHVVKQIDIAVRWSGLLCCLLLRGLRLWWWWWRWFRLARSQVGAEHQIVVVHTARPAQIVVSRLCRRRRRRRSHEFVVDRVAIVHIDVVAIVVCSLQNLCVLLAVLFQVVVINFRDRSIRAAANRKRNHLLDRCAALNALLHDWSAVITRDHVTARLEEN